MWALESNAQNYLIQFAGAGASSSVNTVKIENLTSGISLTVNGNDILHLKGTTGINQIENNRSSELQVYPNPSGGISKLQILPPSEGNAVITVYDITGKKVAQINSYLDTYLQEFQLSGLNNGLYLISVTGSTYHFFGKLLTNSNNKGEVTIEHTSNNQAINEKGSNKEKKGYQATVDMVYSTGDRLKFKAISGNFSTVKTDIPAADNTITFTFIACTDADKNNYPVVEIGSQIWMAENLKTAKYRDGTAIPNVTDNTSWRNLTTGAFCDYDNDPDNSIIFGKLYNWFAAVDTRNLCPTGWRMPTHDEWKSLNAYLGDGMIAGSKLKETGTKNWSPPNTDATNETGFSALPGGYRLGYSVAFTNIKNQASWHSSTMIDNLNSYGACVVYNYGWLATAQGVKQNGYSVRCLKE